MSKPQIALVTGASRGAGKGIALGLAEKGMTVYVTGRSTEVGSAKGWDGTTLPGTVLGTAEEITKAGGNGIAVVCDHADDAQVAALFEQIKEEQQNLRDKLTEMIKEMEYTALAKQDQEMTDAAANVLKITPLPIFVG